MTRTWNPAAMTSWARGSAQAERLTLLWADPTPISVSQIGAIMGVTKNAIVGARNRLNLTPRPSPLKHGGPYAGLRHRTAPMPPLGATLPPLASAGPAIPTGPHIATTGPLTAQPEPCRWPIGEPRTPGFRFCDAPRSRPDRPYCLEHCKLAYQRKAAAV